MQEGLKKGNFLDYSILIPYLILSVLGLIMVFSSTVPAQLIAGQSPNKLFVNQAIFWVVSLVLMFFIYRLKIRTFKSGSLLALFIPIEIGLLLYTRLFSRTVNGSHGWITIGAFTAQPAEYLKIFVVWYLALIFTYRNKKGDKDKQLDISQRDIEAIFDQKTWYENLFTGWRLWLIIMILLVMSMPDFGDATIVVLTILAMLSVSGISYRWVTGYFKFFIGFVAIFIGAIFITRGNLLPGPLSYINKRFVAFINPFQDLSNAGHQLANSYYAIANGGWFGRGLGNSLEKKGYLPEASTDFIFPIIVEELGVIGAVLILGVLFFMILRMLLVGIRARDPFNSVVAIGMSTFILAQVLVNVGGVTGIIPDTGVTFPFFSQGGNSLMVLSIAVAFVLNVSADERRLELLELAEEEKSRRDRRRYK